MPERLPKFVVMLACNEPGNRPGSRATRKTTPSPLSSGVSTVAPLRASASPRETAKRQDGQDAQDLSARPVNPDAVAVQHASRESITDMIVDSFAGGGGASLGIQWALGRAPDYAINHDEAAIAMHRANHPETVHFCESVWKVKPADVVGNGSVQLAWFSPDCTHFSIARGSKPVSPRVRGLAWIVIKWAKLPDDQRPCVIILENVKEFRTWGPLVKKLDDSGAVARDSQGRELEVPCPRRKGVTFKRWLTTLRNLGYEVEWRELDAADYGAPTHRRRFFLIARCDGKRIVWPQASHGDPRKQSPDMFGAKLKPYRTAAECIDWSLPCPSIFLTKDEARVVGKQLGMASLKRPLADNTMRRIANGLLRYVLRAKEPFIVGLGGRQGQSPERSVDRPFQTITGKADSAVVVPYLARADFTTESQSHGDKAAAWEADTQAPATVSPVPLSGCNAGHTQAGDRPAMRKRSGRSSARPADSPCLRDSVVQSSFILKSNHGDKPHYGADEPARTIVAGGTHHAQVVAFLAKHFGGQVGAELPRPLPTTTQRGTQNQVVTAKLAKRCLLFSQCQSPRACQEAGRCLENNQLEASHLVKLRGTSNAAPADEPAPTISSGGTHLAEVRAFLVKYFGTATGQPVNQPAHTVTAKERLGLVTIHGEDWQIVDIGMRMLTPRELARCQGFPDDYVLTGTKTSQVARIGNSVPPQTVEALVRANVGGAA